ncbi:MAG TPA: hypothetical protein VMY77_05355 [Chitinophagaceae bacterium]|nr:hypothetical protein [Chitinophagaceae bacterium]
METHHPHHITHKKKWTEYLLEFFMLFLAVFLGFVAENYREHIVEKRREKEYIKMFIEDLRIDTSVIAANIIVKIRRMQTNDSLIKLLNAPDPDKYGKQIYFYGRQLTRINHFYSADRTIKQLKNSGSLRLIKSQEASDSIILYDQAVEKIYITQAAQVEEAYIIRSLIGKVLNPIILETMIDGENINPPEGNPHLRSTDKDLILDLIYAIHQMKGSDALNTARLRRLRQRATGMIKFLKQEYHLQ